MHDIVDRDEEIIRNVWTRDEAVAFKKNDEPFKIELVEAIPEGETVTFYRQGDFIDLCRDRTCPRPAMGHAFKLMSVAGAYGAVIPTARCCSASTAPPGGPRKELNAYLHMLEEAEKRTIASLAGNSTSSIFRKRRPDRCSGIRMAGPSIARSRPICAGGSRKAAMPR